MIVKPSVIKLNVNAKILHVSLSLEMLPLRVNMSCTPVARRLGLHAEIMMIVVIQKPRRDIHLVLQAGIPECQICPEERSSCSGVVRQRKSWVVICSIPVIYILPVKGKISKFKTIGEVTSLHPLIGMTWGV